MRKHKIAFLLGLALAAPPAPARADPPPQQAGGVDWMLEGAARAFTGGDRLYGDVHLPVIAVNPNSGITYGVLPVWLEHNSAQEITQIFAPMFSYNRTYGAAVDGSYYYYPSGEQRLRVVLAKSERSNYRAAADYYDRALLDGRAILSVKANFEADGGVQFYGVGPASMQGEESSERLLEDLAQAQLGVKFWGDLSAAAGWKLRRTAVQSGPFSAPVPLPASVQTTTTYSLPRLTLSRDTRNLPFTPTDGSLAELYAEYSNTALGSSADYEHYGGQWRLYVPTSESLTTVLHAQAEQSGGGNVPFTALSELGGANSLRGFPEGRFQDRGAAFANVEERWDFHSIELVHSVTDFQVAPFLETGTVFPAPQRAQARYLENVAGVAFRVVVKPDVVGKVEVGAGREGPAVFVGIDYPF